MVTQCTTSQFTTNNGVLGLDQTAMSRVVRRATAQSVGDGPFDAAAPNRVFPPEKWDSVSHKLKTMITQRVHWRNDYGIPVDVEVQIQRQRRTMVLSSPNFAFVRERYTTKLGYDTDGTQVLAADPDPSKVWNTEWGGGIWTGFTDGKPNEAHYRASQPESTLVLEPIRLGPNQALDVRFNASLITAHDWWDKSVIENYRAEMYVFANTIQFRAFPQPV